MTTRKTSSQKVKATAKRMRRTTRRTSQRAVELIGTGISFSAPNVISDSGNGFTAAAGWVEGQEIEVSGSQKNNARFAIQTRADGLLTVTPQLVGTEAAGAVIKIRQGMP